MLADVVRRAGQLVVPIFDNFNRSGSLPGSKTSDGNAEWENLRVSGGVWTTNGSRPVYSGSDNDAAAAVVEANTPDVDITLDVGQGRDALIFRANDADNYHFAVAYRTHNQGNTTKFCQARTYSCTSFTNGNNCCQQVYPNTNCGHNHNTSCNTNGTTSCCGSLGGLTHNHNIYGGDSCFHSHGNPAYAGNSFNTNNYACGNNVNNHFDYRLYFYKRVAGSIQATATHVNTNALSKIRVRAEGNSISYYWNNQNTPARNVDDSFNASANKHGIGRYTIGHAWTSAIDNFDLTPVEP